MSLDIAIFTSSFPFGKIAFILKLNQDGTLAWIRQLGSVSAPGDASLSDQFFDVAVLPSGDPVAGGFTAGGLIEANGGGVAGFRRSGPYQTGRRYAGRCGTHHPDGCQQTHQVCRDRGEDGSPRPVPSFPDGRPYPRDG